MSNEFFRDPRQQPRADELPPDVGEVRAVRMPETKTGHGGEELPVKGLLEVKYVRVGGMTIPPTFEHTFIAGGGNPPPLKTETHPSYVLDARDDGTPVLLRHKRHNFGVWQEGVDIYVGGNWAPEAAVEPAAEATADAVTETTRKAKE